MTLQDQIAFFEKNHYLIIPGALAAGEVAGINAAIDASLKNHRSLWYGKEDGRLQSVHCLLTMPQCDLLLRHPSFFPIARQALDNDIVFSEFSIMIRAGNQKQAGVEGWHRDFMPNPKQRRGITALSAIYYLTDVDETTARYCLVPDSSQMTEAPPKLREDNEDRAGEVQVFGKAGTVVLVNAGIWHCGRWGTGPRERRTAHIYFQPSSIPPVSGHNIYPRRLWDVTDTEQRRFFSHFNPLTAAVAGDYAR